MSRTITIERILEYYDVPQIFIGKDAIESRYLCLLFNMEEQLKYLTIQISPHRLSLFISGEKDLRDLYVNPELKNEYYIATYDKGNFILNDLTASLSENMLPAEGYYYLDEEEDASIIQEAIEQNHPVIHLGFIDTINSHSISVNKLAALTIQYQSMVSNCYKKIDGTKDDTDFKLNVFGYSAASFNVHMYAESSLDLFGSSRIDKTLRTLDKLFRSSNEEELRTVIEPLKGHTIRSYKNFIKELIDNKISVKYKWVSSISEAEVIKNKVTIPILEKTYEILSESSELEKEIKEYEGIMISADITSGRWSLRNIEGKKIRGESQDPNILSGVVLDKVKYKLVCNEIITQSNISSKEQVSLSLLEIEELHS